MLLKNKINQKYERKIVLKKLHADMPYKKIPTAALYCSTLLPIILIGRYFDNNETAIGDST